MAVVDAKVPWDRQARIRQNGLAFPREEYEARIERTRDGGYRPVLPPFASSFVRGVTAVPRESMKQKKPTVTKAIAPSTKASVIRPRSGRTAFRILPWYSFLISSSAQIDDLSKVDLLRNLSSRGDGEGNATGRNP